MVMRLVLSYVDDLVLSLVAKMEAALEALATTLAHVLNFRAKDRYMCFALRGTRISHQGRKADWSIDEEVAVVDELRVLGYWWTKGSVGPPTLTTGSAERGKRPTLLGPRQLRA
jgi:hypothetical protein